MHWISFPASPSEAINTLYEPYLYFCYELALETSAKRSSIKSLRVHDLCHAHSLASLQWSGPSDQWTLLPTENCLQCQKWSPWKRQRSHIYVRLCKKGKKWPSQCQPRLFYSQPSQQPCARHPCWNPPTSPYPTIFASAQIAPTDKMRPKLHDKYTCHQWLKG